MKLIIINKGVAECAINVHIGHGRILSIIEDLCELIPDASMYLDVGGGAQFIYPHCPKDVLQRILTPTNEDSHA